MDPRRAADLYLPELQGMLRQPNTKVYASIAAILATMRGLYERAGDGVDFTEMIAGIRGEYGRRPSLMKALDKRGL